MVEITTIGQLPLVTVLDGTESIAISKNVLGITTTLRTTSLAISSLSSGGVTSITATSPLTGGTITSSGSIGITQASSSVSGYLSSTDWNTFNSKQSSLTFSTGLTNLSGTITANLSTGVSGGQTVIGGTGSTDTLSFQSTTGNQTTGTAFKWLGGNNGASTLMSLDYNGSISSNIQWRLSSGSNQVSFQFSGGVQYLTPSGTFAIQPTSDLYFSPGSVNRWYISSTDGSLNSINTKLVVAKSPTASANYGTTSIGGGAFDGTTSGFFVGSSSGTSIAVNEVSGYAGNLLDLQVAGATKFQVTKDGFVDIRNTNAISYYPSQLNWFFANAGNSTTTGVGNLGVGPNCLSGNAGGQFNTGNGYQSLISIVNANNNSGFGFQTLESLNSGDDNSAFGCFAGLKIADGTTALISSSQSLFLGSTTRAQANSQTNQIVIGYGAIGNGSNTATIGNSSITDNYFNGILHSQTINVIGLPTSGAQFDASGSATINVANGGSATIVPVAGGGSYYLIIISEVLVTGASAVYLSGSGITALIGSTGSLFVAATSSPAASHASVNFSGSVNVYNNQGATCDFAVTLIRIH